MARRRITLNAMNTPRKHTLLLVLTALMALTVTHVHALDLDAVLEAAEKALETPEARAQQEEDMREFVAFQVRSVQ